MLRTVLAVCALLCALTINAEAGPMHKDCNILWPCVTPYASTPDQARWARGMYIRREVGFGGPVVKRAVRAPKARQGFFAESAKKVVTAPIARAISGIVAPLAAKVSEIQ